MSSLFILPGPEHSWPEARGVLARRSDGSPPRTLIRPVIDDVLIDDVESVDPPSWSLPCPWGHYELREHLGRGGCGDVYLAVHSHTGVQRAIKIPHPQVLADPALVQRAISEAQLAREIQHPNVLAVFEANMLDEVPYLVMEFCPGPNLADWLLQRPKLPHPRVATQIVLELAQAMAHVHRSRILHRDIKPTNVLFHPEPSPSGRLPWTPKLSDFGLAKFLDLGNSSTETGQILGTPRYMAPEQTAARSGSLGPETDVYGLGILLYELLTGRTPFGGPNWAETLRLVREEPPQPPRQRRPQIPRWLESACLCCLAKNPADRFPTADALVEALEAGLVRH